MRITKFIDGPILFALGMDCEMNLFVAFVSEPYTDSDKWFEVKPDEKLILEIRSFLKRLKENPEEGISDKEIWAALLEIEGGWEGMQGATAEEMEDPITYPFEKVMARIAKDKKKPPSKAGKVKRD